MDIITIPNIDQTKMDYGNFMFDCLTDGNWCKSFFIQQL